MAAAESKTYRFGTPVNIDNLKVATGAGFENTVLTKNYIYMLKI